MNKENFITGRQRILVYFLFIILGISLSILFFWILEYKNALEIRDQNIKEFNLEEKERKEHERRENLRNKLENKINVQAKAFYVYDLDNSNVIFKRNENKKLGIASLTKIITSVVALENMIEGNNPETEISGNNIITINLTNLKENGEYGLRRGERFLINDLVKFMMVVSSNDAASALTNKVGKNNFIEKMNQMAEKLDLKSTLFLSESGLDIDENIFGAYSSAEDVAHMVNYFYNKHPNISREFSQKSVSVCSEGYCHKVLNTNKLLIPKSVCMEYNEESNQCLNWEEESFSYPVYFSKTGYTEKSGGSLAMVVDLKGHKVLAVILSSGEMERFSDMEEILKITEEYFEKIKN